MLEKLPPEIIGNIFLYTDIQDIYSLSYVNKYCNSISLYILEQKWPCLLAKNNIQILDSFTKKSLSLKELKIYINICFLLKRAITQSHKIKLTLINTFINNKYFKINALKNDNNYILMIYCPININNIERALCFTCINSKFIRIHNISNYYYNTDFNSELDICIFRSNLSQMELTNFNSVSYLLKDINFV